MIKRLRIWIKELNLSQQLLSLVFVTVTVFALFFFVYLSDTINSFVEREMFSILHRTQESVVSYYQNSDDFSDLSKLTDSIITNLIVDTRVQVAENAVVVNMKGSFVYDEQTIKDIIVDSLFSYKDLKQNNERIYQKDDVYVMYTLKPIGDQYLCISLLNDNYRNEYRNTLLNSVINLSFIVVGALFVMLMVWVTTLIHPLNQIRNYIEKIRNDEKAELHIDRRDEIGEVADALVEMQTELKEQAHIKDEMIQNISHDLKTPIATIKSYAESIKDGIYPYDSLEKSVDVIIEHAERLEKKVYSLLVLNKMGYLQDIAPDGKTLDMADVINKVILSMRVVKQDINITTVLNPVYFHGEEEPWRIVVENLLDNAIRYAKSEIVITLNEDELEISNDGPLMSEERLKKLFRPYEKGTDGKFGLGLSIVYRVVTTYNYKVEAENTDNGVLFRIYRLKNNERKHYQKKTVDKIEKKNKEVQ
ncbi:MAG: HAMP domain-containing histidine kinase [Erysipelotrichaceae bacterium]|nr:HAMP domain-containing histidine kinase [Erysipelotrichaceae bacterium]MBQ7890512.1 HAMP domain-containing histidine kinase [Erysipelotrichaceae bacterium]